MYATCQKKIMQTKLRKRYASLSMTWRTKERRGWMNNAQCNDCYLSMQNCHDMSIACEIEEYYGDSCDWFEPMPKEDEEGEKQ